MKIWILQKNIQKEENTLLLVDVMSMELKFSRNVVWVKRIKLEDLKFKLILTRNILYELSLYIELKSNKFRFYFGKIIGVRIFFPRTSCHLTFEILMARNSKIMRTTKQKILSMSGNYLH